MHRYFVKLVYALLLLGVAACIAPPQTAPTDLLLTSTEGAPTIHEADIAEVKTLAQAYLDSWKAEDYAAMYPLLTSVSKDAFSQDEFNQHYESVAVEATLSGIDYEILSVLVDQDKAQVRYRVTLKSLLVGDISRETVMNLRNEKGQWRIEWDDTLVLPELQGGNYLVMDRGGYVPSRANIYDRNGYALVAQADATAVGFLPDQVDPEQADKLFTALSELTGVSVSTIQALYQNAPKGADWYIPLGVVSTDRLAAQLNTLSSLPGVTMRPYKSRYYFEGGIAPHVIGYVSAIQPDEVEEYERLGYQQDERVGRSGLEKWGESYLAGKRGGALYVFNAQGRPVTRLAKSEAQPAQAIYTTLDRDFQMAAQQALSAFRGAIVVLERDTGRVLAMVSAPQFDPNAFEPINYNSSQRLFEISSDPTQPLLNRATQGQYPLGSVFKIITMSAALESGRYTPETTYQCGYFFDELPGARLHDWTYDYYLQGGKVAPSGLLTLPQGLIRSCNPYFWHIGLDLYNQGLTTAISEMARGFGLGKPTGIVGLEEEAGNIPDPASPVDAVNMAIGQGDVLVTPLQVANFVAAVGNGGTLYLPQVVERIVPPGGKPSQVFKPQVIGKLPLSKENLAVVQQAMVGVIRNEKPRGTAWHVFTGLDIPVAGKTGTAQSGADRPHAWFAGYTFAERPDKPDIAVAVVVERVGEGSDYAAPIFRRIVELYFSGQPQKLYWWESSLNVPGTLTPTPLGTAPVETPAP
ncbi:MAG: penicillin-binding transpeptidase domain-containing protein [Anaerolineales bacterium]|nr:penicillin-binding transpeptidase domain-containing protein [Anaerolineales bacterium]